MNFKEWHRLMKNDKYQAFQHQTSYNNVTKFGFQDDFNHRYQEKYVQNHPLTNRIYNGLNNFLNALEQFRKNTYY